MTRSRMPERVKRLFSWPSIPPWAFLAWKIVDFTDTATGVSDWGKPAWDFVSDDENTWLLALVALLCLIFVVTWPDIKGLDGAIRRKQKQGESDTGNSRENRDTQAIPVHDGRVDNLITDLRILSQENLAPNNALMLEMLDVVNPQAKVVKVVVQITIAKKLTPISFARLSIGKTTSYPMTFAPGRFSHVLQPLPLYFELPSWFPAGNQSSRLGILVGCTPRWEEWDFSLCVDATPFLEAEPVGEEGSL